MQTKMQFQKNANVIAANGKPVGQIDRVVVDPRSNVVTHLVVHKGILFDQEDKIIPIDLVSETSPDEIVLRDEAGDLESFPPFEEEHIVDTEAGYEPPVSSGKEDTQPLIYVSPMLGMPTPPVHAERFMTQIEKNIPDGAVAMKEGAKVISADGKHVGNVERVFTDIADEQITHLLVSAGTFTKKTKLVPIDWVKDVNEEEVNLRVYKVSVDELLDTSLPK